uniref:Uncharacterized protein n=1 Tax=Glycine max TaxID=3847 RepID=K7MPD6_SOYBN
MKDKGPNILQLHKLKLDITSDISSMTRVEIQTGESYSHKENDKNTHFITVCSDIARSKCRGSTEVGCILDPLWCLPVLVPVIGIDITSIPSPVMMLISHFFHLSCDCTNMLLCISLLVLGFLREILMVPTRIELATTTTTL